MLTDTVNYGYLIFLLIGPKLIDDFVGVIDPPTFEPKWILISLPIC